MARGNPGDEDAQLEALGATRHKRQARPTFQHLLFGASKEGNLEKVIHHPEAVEACAFGAINNACEGRPQVGLSFRPGKSDRL